MIDAEQFWSGLDDNPWFATPIDEWADTFPATGRSDSGLVITVDRDHVGVACQQRDLLRLVRCFLWRGHDGPHMPCSDELWEMSGPFVVTEMRRP